MSRNIPLCARLYQQRKERWDYGTYCYEVRKLLRQHPDGMTLPNVQRNAQLSVKTAKSVLALVAVEKDGKFYQQKPTTRRKV